MRLGRWLLLFAVTGLGSCAPSHPVVAKASPQVLSRLVPKIELPAGSFQLWINEQEEVRATVAEERSDDGGATWHASVSHKPISLFWVANEGSFTDPNSPVTTYCVSSWTSSDDSTIQLEVIAVQPDEPAQVTPTTAPSRSATDTTRPTGFVDIDTAENFPDSTAFQDELAAARKAVDRDTVISHFRRAMALRPGDPKNLVIEFKIGVMLGQNPDPGHNEPIHPEQALAIFKHIVECYDHHVYYLEDFSGVGNSPDFLVPRAAVLVASYLNAAGDVATAEKYLSIAMKDMQWTSEKRKADWQSPLPPQHHSPFGDRLNGLRDPKKQEAFRQKQWAEKKKRAESGDVFEDSEMNYAKAAVRQYRISFAMLHPENPTGATADIIRQFHGTPIAVIAQNFQP